ncbi:MAG: hypothetical protein II794_08410, partial [Oscillospiraceae bacterium]|nr:hypothetical protein [Oscillospiraceae bacterium]
MTENAAGRLAASVKNKTSLFVDFLEYVLIFTVIVECNSLFHYTENYRHTSAEVIFTLIAIGLAALLILIYGLVYRESFIRDIGRSWPVFAAVFLYMAVFFIFNVRKSEAPSAVRKYLLSFVLFLSLAYVLLRLHKISGRPHELFYKYSNLMAVIACANLVVYAAVTVRPDIAQSNYILTEWSSRSTIISTNNYLNLYASGLARNMFGISLPSNRGFFTEQLMYCVPLMSALYIEMFLRAPGQRKIWKWALFLFVLLLGQSTLGWMLAAATCCLKMGELCLKRRSPWRILGFIVTLGLTVLAIWYLFQTKAETSVGSTKAHLEHFAAAFKTFFQAPVFGVGYMNEAPIVANLSYNMAAGDPGLSNSLGVCFAEGGLVLGLFCLVPFFLPLVFRKNLGDWSRSLWILGPLAVYLLTVYIFHLVLMLFLAYGFASIELPQTQGRHSRRREEETPAEITAERSRLNPRQIGMIALFGLAAAVITLLLFTSGQFWQGLVNTLTAHQLLLGQSVWKVYCFNILIILLTLSFIHWGRREDNLVENSVLLGLLAAWTLAFGALYPTVYAVISTALAPITFFGDLFETAALVLVFGLGALSLLLIARAAFRRDVLHIAAAVLAVIAAAGAFYLANSRAEKAAVKAESFASRLSGVQEASIYANELPVAFKKVIPNLTYSGARDDGFSAYGTATVIANHDRRLTELFNHGFRVTELSEDYILYSNDEKVISALEEQGYTFYRYCPFEIDIEHGPIEYLPSSVYTLTANLRFEGEAQPGDTVCRVLVTAYDGASTLSDRAVKAKEFDKEGSAAITIRLSGSWEKLTYEVVNEGGHKVTRMPAGFAETPSYITSRIYDGRRLVLREEYYNLDGTARKVSGYYGLEREYDRRGSILTERYLDENGEPAPNSSGYAQVRYEYNGKAQRTRTAYFDAQGQPVALKAGYAVIENEYDKVGNVTLYRYLDTEGRPALYSGIYFEERREYNEARKLVSQSYFDAEGKPAALKAGYWKYEREYDAAGNQTVFRYLDTQGKPVVTTSHYAEMRREYNDRNKLIRESY